MKKTLRDSLPSEWLKYFVVAFLAVLIWVWAFGFYHAPKSTETIEVFFVGTIKEGEAFEGDAKRAFEGLKSVNLAYADPSAGNAFKDKFTAVGLTSSDVMIIPESLVAEGTCKRYYAPMTKELGEMYKQEDISYGVYLTDANKEKLSPYFNFTEERYVVFALASSVNSGDKTNHSFDFIEWLVR